MRLSIFPIVPRGDFCLTCKQPTATVAGQEQHALARFSQSTRQHVTAFGVVVLLVLAGCGGTAPTAPTSATSRANEVTTTPPPVPDPAPVPPPPTPDPAPVPAPAPPAPAPAPKPQPEMLLDATTFGGVWKDPAGALPATFVIEIWPDAVWLGNVRVPRVDMPEHLGIAARDANTMVTLQRSQVANTWDWWFSGVAGTAGGKAVAR